MIHTLITSFRLKNTYRVNSIIYSIKGLPIIRKVLSNDLYKSKFLKVLGNIISIIIEICSIFLGKFLYIWLAISSIAVIYQTDPTNTFLHLFFFLTLAGGILNTYMFNPTKDKYYAIVIMNMDANQFAISNYSYSMLKVFVGFLPFTIIFGTLAQIPLWICILLPFFVVMIKMTVIGNMIRKYKQKGVVNNENLPTKVSWIILILLLVIAYGFPYVGIVLPVNIFLFLCMISFLLGTISFMQIYHFKDYKKMYKLLLTPENVYALQNANSTKTIKDNIASNINYDGEITSDKKGFAYFHELFIKRHSKLLTKSAKKQTLFIVVVFSILIMISYMIPELREKLNNIPLTYLPYFVFIMYLLNRGTTITQAMFMNCDHSMLTYRIYRTPRVILGVFKERIKTLIKINLLPSSVLGLGLMLLLYTTGGTDNFWNYLILFVSVNAMSIFFSVHYLVMYYLLQPYNVNTEIKSSTYTIVQSLTYFACYYMIQLHLPTISFGIATIIFSIAYSFISLLLVYHFAPKTFKLRI